MQWDVVVSWGVACQTPHHEGRWKNRWSCWWGRMNRRQRTLARNSWHPADCCWRKLAQTRIRFWAIAAGEAVGYTLSYSSIRAAKIQTYSEISKIFCPQNPSLESICHLTRVMWWFDSSEGFGAFLIQIEIANYPIEIANYLLRNCIPTILHVKSHNASWKTSELTQITCWVNSNDKSS